MCGTSKCVKIFKSFQEKQKPPQAIPDESVDDKENDADAANNQSLQPAVQRDVEITTLIFENDDLKETIKLLKSENIGYKQEITAFKEYETRTALTLKTKDEEFMKATARGYMAVELLLSTLQNTGFKGISQDSLTWLGMNSNWEEFPLIAKFFLNQSNYRLDNQTRLLVLDRDKLSGFCVDFNKQRKDEYEYYEQYCVLKTKLKIEQQQRDSVQMPPLETDDKQNEGDDQKLKTEEKQITVEHLTSTVVDLTSTPEPPKEKSPMDVDELIETQPEQPQSQSTQQIIDDLLENEGK